MNFISNDKKMVCFTVHVILKLMGGKVISKLRKEKSEKAKQMPKELSERKRKIMNFPNQERNSLFLSRTPQDLDIYEA